MIAEASTVPPVPLHDNPKTAVLYLVKHPAYRLSAYYLPRSIHLKLYRLLRW